MSTPMLVNGLTIDDLLSFHRATFGSARMDGGAGGAGDGGSGGDGGKGDGAGQTFTQADVDRIVSKARSEERRKASEKYADYDDLKAKADGAKTLEDRVAAIEDKATKAEARALRAEVANAKGLTPSQARRLVGASKDELEADADELLKDIGAQRKRGNHVPGEGTNPKSNGDGDGMRAFTRNLFGAASGE